MQYKEKYLKYKQKYLNLLQDGGSNLTGLEKYENCYRIFTDNYKDYNNQRQYSKYAINYALA